MITALFAAAALMQAAPAAAATTVAAPVAHVTTSTVVVHTKDSLVCHEETLVGSRFPKKICAPKKAVDERTKEDRQQVEQWQSVNPLHVN